MAAFKGGI